MLKYAVILGLVALAGLRVGAVQESRCSTDPQRRLAAVNYARLLNGEEARFFSVPQLQRYGSMAELGVSAPPDGFQVQLSSDSTGYTFSIKDTLDACHWALFSDQQGLIYTAQPLQ
jgi:hypothetical protein